jgi:C-terminal processing protease CtpA/Prc
VRAPVTFAYHASARRLPGTNIAYLNLPSFITTGIAREVREELNKLGAAGPLDGLVIDVRQNGGGSIFELTETEKLFIDGGLAGYSSTRQGRIRNTIPGGQTLPALRGKPVVLLVSGLCESACEHLAIAMHDLKRATVIGTNTAGNTETLYPYDFEDGSRLFLAETLLLRADGSSIEDTGLTPAVVMDVPWYRFSIEEDPQVRAGVEAIQQAGR